MKTLIVIDLLNLYIGIFAMVGFYIRDYPDYAISFGIFLFIITLLKLIDDLFITKKL